MSHDHQNQRQQTHSIQPGNGAWRHGSSDGRGHVEAADLTDPGRLIDPDARWCGCGRPTAIDAELLNFTATAVHAATVTRRHCKPIKDRAALFAAMVRRGDWSKVTGTDEDEARRQRSTPLHGGPGKPREKPQDALG